MKIDPRFSYQKSVDPVWLTAALGFGLPFAAVLVLVLLDALGLRLW